MKSNNLRFITAINAICDSPMLQQCIDSLLCSHYDGNIVVLSPDSTCAHYSQSRVSFFDTMGTTGADDMILKYLSDSGSGYDIIINLHTDVKVYDEWYDAIEPAWSYLYDGNHVWAVTLPSIIPEHSEQSIHDMLTLDYDTFCNNYSNRVIHNGANCGSYSFGLGVDFFNTTPTVLYSGRTSPLTSFRVDHILDTHSKYQADRYAFCLRELMMYDGINRHMMSLWSNTKPVIHFLNYDTTYNNSGKWKEKHTTESYTIFQSLTGYGLDHVITKWCNIIVTKYHDRILKDVNSNNFSEMGYLYEDAIAEIKDISCSNCLAAKFCRASGGATKAYVR